MEQRYKMGQKVFLNTGGPNMTITDDKLGVDLTLGKVFNGKYLCSWFDEEKKLQQAVFPEDGLNKAS